MLASIRSQCAKEHKPTQLHITGTKPPYLSVLSRCSSLASDSSKNMFKRKKRKEKNRQWASGSSDKLCLSLRNRSWHSELNEGNTDLLTKMLLTTAAQAAVPMKCSWIPPALYVVWHFQNTGSKQYYCFLPSNAVSNQGLKARRLKTTATSAPQSRIMQGIFFHLSFSIVSVERQEIAAGGGRRPCSATS